MCPGGGPWGCVLSPLLFLHDIGVSWGGHRWSMGLLVSPPLLSLGDIGVFWSITMSPWSCPPSLLSVGCGVPWGVSLQAHGTVPPPSIVPGCHWTPMGVTVSPGGCVSPHLYLWGTLGCSWDSVIPPTPPAPLSLGHRGAPRQPKLFWGGGAILWGGVSWMEWVQAAEGQGAAGRGPPRRKDRPGPPPTAPWHSAPHPPQGSFGAG